MSVHAELCFIEHDRENQLLTQRYARKRMTDWMAAELLKKTFIDALSFMTDGDQLTITFLVDKNPKE
jgi:hypothetical protein